MQQNEQREEKKREKAEREKKKKTNKDKQERNKRVGSLTSGFKKPSSSNLCSYSKIIHGSKWFLTSFITFLEIGIVVREARKRQIYIEGKEKTNIYIKRVYAVLKEENICAGV